jgi:hypothetical protein
MADLRAFASDVFQNGAHAVLFLPTLPPPLGLAVLETLAMHLAEDSLSQQPTAPTRARLLDALDAVRQQIMAWELPVTPPPDEDPRVELAWSATLFVQEDPPASAS